MIIDIREYLLDYIGTTNWYGDSQQDDVSSQNLDRLDKILTELEELREVLKDKLTNHIVYKNLLIEINTFCKFIKIFLNHNFEHDNIDLLLGLFLKK